MPSGRRPKPDVLKIADGTYRADRARKNPPRGSGQKPKCPFSVSSIAGRKWKEITTGLIRLGIIDKIDATHVETLCHQYQIAKEADKVVKKLGILIPGSTGSLVANPACSISANAWGKVRSCCNDLGLNHLSRQRMESTQPKEETDIEAKYLA